MGSFYSVGAFLALMILTGVLAILQLKKKQKNWRITIPLLILFCVTLLIGLLNVLEDQDSTDKNKKEIIDSTSSSTNRIESIIDTTSDVIIKTFKNEIIKVNSHLDSLFKKMLANSESIQNSQFPSSFNVEIAGPPSQDSTSAGKFFDLYFLIQNLDSLNSFDVTDKFTAIYYIDKKYKLSRPFSIFPPQSILPNQTIYSLGTGFLDYKKTTVPIFFYYKFSYISKSGLIINSIRKIYRLENYRVRSVYPDEYKGIMSALKENNYW